MSMAALSGPVLLLFGCTLLSAFYSGIETASYAVSRIKVRYGAEAGVPFMKSALFLLEHHTFVVIATLVGTNLAVYFAGEAAFDLTSRVFTGRVAAEVVSTLWLTPFVFVTAEVIPKVVFRRRADAVFPAASRVLYLSVLLFFPAVVLLSGAVRLMRWVVPGVNEREPVSKLLERAFTRQGLREYAAAGVECGAISRGQFDVMAALMEDLGRPVEEFARPLVFLPVVDVAATIREAVSAALAKGHSAVLIREGDAVSGMVYLYDLVRAEPGEPVSRYLRPVTHVGPGTTLREALDRMKREGLSVLVVKENAGDILGAVSRKSLVAALVKGRGER